MTKFLDTAIQTLGSIEKIEKYRRAFDVAGTALTAWSSRLLGEWGELSFGPDLDAELFSIGLIEKRIKDLKQKLILTHDKHEYKMIEDELDKLYNEHIKFLKRQHDRITAISRNI